MRIIPNLAKIPVATLDGYGTFIKNCCRETKLFQKYNVAEAKVASGHVPTSKLARILCYLAQGNPSLGSPKKKSLLEEAKSFF